MRTRFSVYGECEQGQGQSISFAFTCPYHMILTCFKAAWGVIPTTSEFIEVTKSRAANPLATVVLLRENPRTATNPFPPPGIGLTEYMNTDNIELLKDDIVTVTYANSDDEDCNAEMILEEV